MKNERIQEILDKNTIECMGVKQVDHFAFAKAIIDECMKAIERTPKHLAYTTYDYGLMEASIRSCKTSVKEHFRL